MKTQYSIARPVSLRKPTLWSAVKANSQMYLIVLLGLCYLIIFKYVPMYGVVIAFQEYNIFDGISGSKWVGIQQFSKLFQSQEFYQVLINTLSISVYKIVFLFPAGILVALLLNEMHNLWCKKIVQTIIYVPHFLSWVVVGGIFTTILSPSTGVVNHFLEMLGMEPIAFMMSNEWFRTTLVVSAGWKEVGWNAIIYIAAIAGIAPELYEAAYIDGAGKIKQIIHITLPSITSTIVLMFILRLGSILEAGTEQIMVMYNPTVYNTGDVIGSYVYRMGLGKMEYSFSTAVGLFNSLVGFLLVIGGNAISRRLNGNSIW